MPHVFTSKTLPRGEAPKLSTDASSPVFPSRLLGSCGCDMATIAACSCAERKLSGNQHALINVVAKGVAGCFDVLCSGIGSARTVADEPMMFAATMPRTRASCASRPTCFCPCASLFSHEHSLPEVCRILKDAV